MLSLGAGARRVYLAVGATDLRKGFDGLYGLLRSRLEEDPMSGQLVVFCNAGRTPIKTLYFEAVVCFFVRSGWPEAALTGRRRLKGLRRWPSARHSSRR
jgi:transposase